MSNLNLYILENLTENKFIEDSDYIFNVLLKNVESFLGISILKSKVNIIYNKLSREENNLQEKNILHLGVEKKVNSNSITINILREYKDFLPFILLREAFCFFVPKSIRKNFFVRILINQNVEKFLNKNEAIKNWKNIIRSHLTNYNVLTAHLSRMEKFFSLQSEEMENPTIFFFKYIRENETMILRNEEDFYKSIFKSYFFKTSEVMNKDNIVETIRILMKIFYEIKTYKSLSEYQDYFKKFKESNKLTTDFSTTKFVKNIHYINSSTFICPSYKINWDYFGVITIFCYLEFNPLLNKTKINDVLKELPFFTALKPSSGNFSKVYSGIFLIPEIYIEDLKRFFVRLKQSNYILNIKCIQVYKYEKFLNLNYFREFYKKDQLINPNHSLYNKKYEFSFKSEFKKDTNKYGLDVIDFLLFNRLIFTGFGFERKLEMLRKFKEDLSNYKRGQKIKLNELKKNLENIFYNLDLKKKFLSYLNTNRSSGFFATRKILGNLLLCLSLTTNILNKNKLIIDTSEFLKYIKENGISQSIEENVIFNQDEVKKFIIQNVLPKYFQYKNSIKELTKEYNYFFNFLSSCYELKILNFQAIEQVLKNEELLKKIILKRESIIKEISKNFNSRKITYEFLDSLIDIFSNNKPALIQPFLINTIDTSNFSNYYLQIILRFSPEIDLVLKEIKPYFTSMTIQSGTESFSNQKLLVIDAMLPDLNLKEKKELFSILYNKFKENLISIKRHFWKSFEIIDLNQNFYDFEKNEFFYTKDLFEQYYLFIKKRLGTLNHPKKKDIIDKPPSNFWLKNDNLIKLVERNIKRKSWENIKYDYDNLAKLFKLHFDLNIIILKNKDFKDFRDKVFFKNYVRSIKFDPAFQNFGLNQFFLYVQPSSYHNFNIKNLLSDNFQSLKYPANLTKNSPLFIKYLIPSHNPSKFYSDSIKSNTLIREYCSFFIKKVYQIFHIDHNLSNDGWELNSNQFKNYLQKILFDPNFTMHILNNRTFSFENLNPPNFYGPKSNEYQDFFDLYNKRPTDIKTFLGTSKTNVVNKILNLFKKDLIFPFIKLKNLNLIERMYFIIPNIKPEFHNLIRKIFNYFNFGFIYEIEGKYFIEGFPNEIQFENGLFIKLYLPEFEMNQFLNLFDLLFEYLKIEDYIILMDLINGDNLVKKVIKDFSYKNHNPLSNLEWDNQTKVWKRLKKKEDTLKH